MSGPLYGGLLSYFQFDSGSEPEDNSGYENNGAFTAAAATSGGLFGNAMRTSSSTGKLAVATMPALLAPKPAISVQVWVNPDMAFSAMWGGGNPLFVDKRNGLPQGYALGVLTPSSNVISFQVHNAAGTPYTASFTETAVGSGWIHYVGTYVGSTVTLWRNGVAVATAVADGTFLEDSIDPMDSIGLGFQGLIDEFALWSRALDSGDVAELYNSGAGLKITWPEIDPAPNAAQAFPPEYVVPGYSFNDATLPTVPVFDAPDHIPFMLPLEGFVADLYLISIASPYQIVDSPIRLFINPNPVITSISVDGNFNITAVGTGGPTDALEVETWWEIEIIPGLVMVIADEVNTVGFYFTRQSRTDHWVVPPGQNWQGLQVTFVMQAVEDAAQIWFSPPVTLVGPGYNNGTGVKPIPPLPPGPPLGPTSGPVIGPPGPGVFRFRTRDFSTRQF